MHATALEKRISYPDVLMVSQRLDEAINELYKVDLIEKVGKMNSSLEAILYKPSLTSYTHQQSEISAYV